MKTFGFKIDGKEYKISVEEKENNIYEMELNGIAYTVEYENRPSINHIVAPANEMVPKTEQKSIAKVPEASVAYSVKAPIPGNIIKIAVKVGQHVKHGDSLLTLESMKMENDILSEKNAVVKAIYVKEGDAIMQDHALMDLE